MCGRADAMSDSDCGAAIGGDAERDARPIGIVAAGVGCMFRPAATARRANGLSILWVFLLHAISLVGSAVAIFVLAAWDDSIWWDRDVWALTFKRAVGVFEAVTRADVYELAVAALYVGLVVVLTELVFVALAMWGMIWGARDESMWRSFGHACRRSWLQSPHVLLLIILVGSWQTYLCDAENSWETTFYEACQSRPDSDRYFTQEGGTSQPTGVYYVSTRAFWDAQTQARPWWSTQKDALIAAAYIGGSLWFLLAWLAAVGAGRPVKPRSLDPMCDSCGYSLVGASDDGRCPECGRLVMDSLGPDARQGPVWLHRKHIGYLRAWWLTGWQLVKGPSAFGAQLPVVTPQTAHRGYWLAHLPVAALIGAVCIAGAVIVDESLEDVLRRPQLLPLVLLAGFAYGMALFLLLTFGSAILAALRWFGGSRRNPFIVAMQMSAYAAPYTLFCLFVAAVMVIACFALAEAGAWRYCQRVTGITRDTCSLFVWIIPTLSAVVPLFFMVGRGTKAGRYANK